MSNAGPTCEEASGLISVQPATAEATARTAIRRNGDMRHSFIVKYGQKDRPGKNTRAQRRACSRAVLHGVGSRPLLDAVPADCFSLGCHTYYALVVAGPQANGFDCGVWTSAML